jgi:Transposase
MKASTLTADTAFVGIDWADRKHDVCLQVAGCDTREFSVLPHHPERMAQWAQALRQRFEGRPIAVCLELRTGPLLSALQPYDFLVLFPVNPTTLAKSREAFCLSHAKDDPTDAELALELLMAHRDLLTALHPQSIAMRPVQRLVEQRRTLVADKVHLTNRLTAALKPYFPQVLEWFKGKDTVVFCDFLTRWPTLKQAQQARKARLTAFFHEPNGRYPHIVEERPQAILQATPLTFDAGVIVPNRLLVEVLIQQLRVVLQAIGRFDREIAQLAPTLPD